MRESFAKLVRFPGRRARSAQVPLLWMLCATLSFCVVGCKKEEEILWKPAPPQDPASAPKAPGPDRLPPGQLLEGPESVHGFSVPKGMRVRRFSPRTVELSGEVNADDAVAYVKDRIVVRHAEMIGTRILFPQAQIKGGDKGVFEFSVQSRNGKTIITVEDQTPRPGTQGLSEEQRWNEVGLTPQGDLIDPDKME